MRGFCYYSLLSFELVCAGDTIPSSVIATPASCKIHTALQTSRPRQELLAEVLSLSDELASCKAFASNLQDRIARASDVRALEAVQLKVDVLNKDADNRQAALVATTLQLDETLVCLLL